MHGKALKYLMTECTGSAVVNGLLNLLAGYLLFRGRAVIPVAGPPGIVRDTIGETFLVVSLSYLAAALISRGRRRTGILPSTLGGRTVFPGNVYLRSFLIGVLFTVALVPLNSALLPHLYPAGLSVHQVMAFKTIYGAVLGAIASWLAIIRALGEPQALQAAADPAFVRETRT